MQSYSPLHFALRHIRILAQLLHAVTELAQSTASTAAKPSRPNDTKQEVPKDKWPSNGPQHTKTLQAGRYETFRLRTFSMSTYWLLASYTAQNEDTH